MLRFKRHYPILLAFVLVIAFFALILGGQRVIAYTVQPAATDTASLTQSTQDFSAEVELFDDSILHSIQVIISDADYQAMLSTYQQTGEKDYFHVDVIIDGVRINDVGLRLKGNASLMTALGGSSGMHPQAAAGQMPGGAVPQNMPAGAGNLPEGFDPNTLPDGAIPRQGPGNFDPANPPAGALPEQQANAFPSGTADAAVKIPLLIKFDEFVSGQTYQGHTKLALRTYGIHYDEAMLDETLTNYAFQEAGMPAVLAAYGGLQINDEAERLYVITEVVDDPVYLARTFANPDGVLYKAEVGSSLSYVNEDPSSYSDSFSQETRLNDADMAPLIAFMRFLSEADEATFERLLPSYLDVDSFATYLALTNLLVNNDSIVGMNNNYYLYYDESTARFTLLYWDGNESLGGLGGGGSATFELFFQEQAVTRTPGGGENILLQRFKANETFMALYEEKLKQVYADVFLSGAITAKAQAYAELIRLANPARSLVDLEAYEQAYASVQSFLERRMEYVNGTELMSR